MAEHYEGSDWDVSLSEALVHRRVHLATVLAAAHDHDSIAEIERELAVLDADIAAGIGALTPERRAELIRLHLPTR